MIETEKNEIRTNLAWQNLYDRLDKDGLLKTKTTEHSSRFYTSVTGWAAAVVILLGIGTAGYFLTRSTENRQERPLLSVQNEQNNTTLIKTLEDGSVVYLGDNARLSFPEHFDIRKREVILEGNALFDVQGNPDRPFYIETNQILIEVTGTSFHINNSAESGFELAVEKGEVKVTFKGHAKSTSVRAGETIMLSASNQFRVKKTEDTEQFGRFMQYIRFKDEKLGNVLAVLNRRSSGIIIHSSPDVNDIPLTFTFSDHSNEQIAELICTALNLTCKKEENIVFISD